MTKKQTRIKLKNYICIYVFEKKQNIQDQNWNRIEILSFSKKNTIKLTKLLCMFFTIDDWMIKSNKSVQIFKQKTKLSFRWWTFWIYKCFCVWLKSMNNNEKKNPDRIIYLMDNGWKQNKTELIRFLRKKNSWNMKIYISNFVVAVFVKFYKQPNKNLEKKIQIFQILNR